MSSTEPYTPAIVVLGGVNGAGKSSLAGERARSLGLDYFNPSGF